MNTAFFGLTSCKFQVQGGPKKRHILYWDHTKIIWGRVLDHPVSACVVSLGHQRSTLFRLALTFMIRSSSWWLQMHWYLIGTRSYTATMPSETGGPGILLLGRIPIVLQPSKRSGVGSNSGIRTPLNIKTIFRRYGDSHVKDKTVVRPSYLKRGVPTLVRRHLYIETGPCRFRYFIATANYNLM